MSSLHRKVCKVCNIEKVRIWAGRFRGSTKRTYLDETGKPWFRATCPPCYKQEKRAKKKLIQEQRKELGSATPLSGNKQRICRICYGDLPPNRYFSHEACIGTTEYWDMADDYQWRTENNSGSVFKG